MDQDPAQYAIELVKVLTGPGPSPAAASDASNALQKIQLSPAGWAIGDTLLQSDIPNLRFYGAITFQIKLNRQARSLSTDDADHVRSRLIDALLYSTQVNDPAFVQRKIAGTLATYFTKSPFPWNNALAQVLAQILSIALPSLSKHADAVNVLSASHKNMLYQLGISLAEDVGNEQGDSPYHKKLEDSMKSNNPTIMALLEQLPATNSSESKTIEAGLTCFVAWCNYGHRRWRYDPDVKYDLINMVDSVLPLLTREPVIAKLALESFTSILDQCPDVLNSDQTGAVWQHVSNILPNYVLDTSKSTLIVPDEDDLPTLKLVPALASSMISQLYDAPSDSTTRVICGILQRLPLASAYPGDDGDLLSPVCSFLIDFAEHVSSSEDSTDDEIDPRREASQQLLLGAIRFLVETFRPAVGEAFRDGTWVEDDYWSQSVEDIFEVMTEVANIPGGALSSYIISLVMRAIDSRNWQDLDFALSAALAIRDGVGHNDMLGMVFNSSLLHMVTDAQSGMPLNIAKIVVRFVESYQDFFAHQTTTLLTTLEQILIIQSHFSCSLPDLSDQAARCVNALCSSSRAALVQNLSQLTHACLAAMESPASTSYQREKIAGGLTCVIESLQNEQDKIQPLELMLEFVQGEISASSTLLDQGDKQRSEERGVSALQVLAAMGKGLQRRAGDSGPTEDSSADNDSGVPTASHVWNSEEGQKVQRRILDCLNHITQLQSSGDAIDATCAVLRVGLTEEVPNPFVFPASVVCGFLEMMNLEMPRVEALLTTACAFISAASRNGQDPSSTDGIAKVYHAVTRLLIQLGDPQSDPQVAQLCNDFLERLALNFFPVFLALPPTDLLTMFSVVLACLGGTAPMLKRASAGLISNILDQTSPAKLAALRRVDTTANVAAQAEHLIEQLAPHIANTIMHQIRGQAQRSELDSIGRVLRAFVSSRGQLAKPYLEQAMSNDPIVPGPAQQGDGVSDADKKAFLQKIVLLRGNLQTNNVVKEFWAACRGTVTSF